MFCSVVELSTALIAASSLWANDGDAEARQQLEAARYLHRVALAQQALAADDSARADAFLDQCPTALRRWEWRYLKCQCDPSLLTIARHERAALAVAYSPDGKRLAS